MSYNLDNGILKNKIYIDGDKPITNDVKSLLEKYDIIHFNRNFNQDLGNLPSNIKAIRFDDNENYYYKWHYYQQHVNTLENSQRYEYNKFNQPINNLPNGIEYLELSGQFNQSLTNLPNTLKYLYLNINNCSNSLDYLPSGLEYLILSNRTGIETIYGNNLPIDLKELYIDGYNKTLFGIFPGGLQILYINGKQNKLDLSLKLPQNLKTFIFNDNTEWNKENLNILKQIIFPKSLMVIMLPIDYTQYYTFFKDKILKECNNCIIKFKNFISDETFNELIKHILDRY